MTDGMVASNNVLHTPLLAMKLSLVTHVHAMLYRFGAREGLTEPLISSSYTELGCKYRLHVQQINVPWYIHAL